MDFLPTKGIEYLLVIAYLAIFTAAWFAVRRSLFGQGVTEAVKRVATAPWMWLNVPRELYFHRGHTWAAPEEGDVFRVGIDDFARRVVGLPDELSLPSPGTQVEQGEAAVGMTIGGRAISLLSPVRGEVVEVNEDVASAPHLVSDDPYGDGWLMKVRVPKAKTTIRNLMSGKLAAAWMSETADRLGAVLARQHGAFQQDGGEPITGFARHLEPEAWREVVTELLLVDEAE